MINSLSVSINTKPQLSIKTQTLIAITAIIAAVIVPQAFHALGAVSGLGTSLGEVFLPMHLPIILAGLLAGPYAGGIAGLLGPVLSFALTGMPNITMLPFIMLELCGYGIIAGLLRSCKLPTLVKLLITQIGGRIARATATVIAVYAFGNESIQIASIWLSIITGVFGIVLQWVLLPLIVYRVENMKKA